MPRRNAISIAASGRGAIRGALLATPWLLLTLPAAARAQSLFSDYVSYDAGRVPQSVAIADLNADGHPDLVVAADEAGVWILFGYGNGTFGAKTHVNVAGVVDRVAVADLNADGKPDLVAHDSEVGISVLLGNGNGTFRAAAAVSSGTYQVLVAIADLNADGQPDLVLRAGSDVVRDFSGSDSVSVLLGNGDGTFGTKTDFGTGLYPGSPAIADLNEDGRLDLVVANFDDHGPGNGGGNTVSVLLGNGDGTFGTKTDYQTPQALSAVVLANLYGEPPPDMVVATSSGVAVFLHTGRTTGVVPRPRAFELSTPNPNPSPGTSEIRFVLPSERPVEIDLFDVTGRRVWSWASRESMSVGQHTITWNGQDGSGTFVSNGLCFLKLRAGRDQGVRKLVIQR